jgi:hypothetical protein
MYNKVNSTAVRGSRKPGRPFNTTKHPWRSTAIGREIFLPNAKASRSTLTRLRTEGFDFMILSETVKGTRLLRVA